MHQTKFISCHSEPRSGEESLICRGVFTCEERFFAPGVYPEPAEGVAQNDTFIFETHSSRVGKSFQVLPAVHASPQRWT